MSAPASTTRSANVSRRDLIKLGAAATTAIASTSSAFKVDAAPEPVKFGLIGVGARGSFLLEHLARLEQGQCVALCDISQQALDAGATLVHTNPRKYKDHRDLLADKNVEAVIIALPLYLHFPVTADSLLAGKHLLCESSLVFKPEEVHALRALALQHPRQIVQVALQRRYSLYFQCVKNMIDQGVLGDVTHIHAQWHSNPGWVMQAGGKSSLKNWRLFREFSGGLTSELAAHHVDVAAWFFGSQADFVVGVGGLDTRKDGRDVYDNIQLIYGYPKGRKLLYSAITTCQHLPILSSQRSESGMVIMGTAGAVELTFGSENAPPTALWFREPTPTTEGATVPASSPQKGIPILTPATQVDWKNDSFLTRESKAARSWLYAKGIMVPEEDKNPVRTQFQSFFEVVRSGERPRASVDAGLAASTAVILANLAMDENRRVFFNEIEKMGKEDKVKEPLPARPGKPAV